MGTRQRRDQEAKQRRQSILGAAKDIFWKHGYAAATIPKVAAAAQLAPGTLYLYFPSKEALYAELLAEGYEMLHQRLVDSVHPGTPPRRQAEALIDAFVKFARENPEYFDIVFFVLQREGSNREGRLDAAQVHRLKALEGRCRMVAGQVLRGVGGNARRDQAAVDALWSMLAGVIFYFGNDPSFDRVARQAKRLLLSAIFPVD
ncbi:MAG: TetR/AcrR family transcriptional regulator [Tepidisphaeraceae bacterium]